MIKFHTASFFDKRHHRGQCFSIAFSQPKGFHHKILKALVPPVKLLSAFRAGRIDEEEYKKRYQRLVLDKTSPLVLIQTILMRSPGGVADNVTLLCWEKAGNFCHRRLVYDWLEKGSRKTKKYRMGEEY